MEEHYTKEEEAVIHSLKHSGSRVAPSEAAFRRVLMSISKTNASTPIEPAFMYGTQPLEWNTFWNGAQMIPKQIKQATPLFRYSSLAAVAFVAILLIGGPKIGSRSGITAQLQSMNELSETEARETSLALADLNETGLNFANQDGSEDGDIDSLLNL